MQFIDLSDKLENAQKDIHSLIADFIISKNPEED